MTTALKNHLSQLRLAEAVRAARGLVIYRGILRDPVCRAMLACLEAVTGEAGPADVLEAYGELFYLLAERGEEAGEEPVGDAWQNHLLDLLIYDDNSFSRGAAEFSPAELGASLRAAAGGDLRRLQALYQADTAAVRQAVLVKLGEENLPAGDLPLWEDLTIPAGSRAQAGRTREIKNMLGLCGDWGRCLEKLAAFYRMNGSGLFGRYRALRWVSREGCLEGIAEPDPVRLEELIGYQSQRRIVLENTERFLAGLPANNLLLYGDRGTGKSSTVKALLNQYGDRGLRMVEVPKSALADFPQLLRQLRSRPQRFILFVDDLSFEESEVEYKELKAILEGSLESRPANLLIYATSNRRHLVRERFADRAPAGGQDGEIRGNDTVQEKLSLADRFGITVLFTTPERSLYLEIVRGLAGQRGVNLEKSELERLALQWEAWHNGRSGRTARQFIDQICGGNGLAAKGPEIK